jgi:hypothetical protein
MNKQAFDFECYGVPRVDKEERFMRASLYISLFLIAVVLFLETFLTPTL